jgi:hypothetical protein
MIIIRIALTLTEYDILLKDIIAKGIRYPDHKGDTVERWIAEQVGRLVEDRRPKHEEVDPKEIT